MNAGDPARATEVILDDGTPVVLRPLRADDQSRLAAFHAGLSSRSVYQRYFHHASLEQRIARAHQALARRLEPAYGLVIVAERDTAGGGPELLGIGRLKRTEPAAAEMALVVVDHWQGRGLGRALTARLVEGARSLGIRRLRGDMLAGNEAMRALVQRAGFVVRPVAGDAAVLRAELAIAQ